MYVFIRMLFIELQNTIIIHIQNYIVHERYEAQNILIFP